MKTILAVAGVAHKGNTVLIAKRKGGSFDGRWEFPGGKPDKGEPLMSAVEREFKEEFDVIVRAISYAGIGKHIYVEEEKEIILHAFHVELLDGDYTLSIHKDIAWVKPQDLHMYDLLEADRPFIPNITRQRSFNT